MFRHVAAVAANDGLRVPADSPPTAPDTAHPSHSERSAQLRCSEAAANATDQEPFDHKRNACEPGRLRDHRRYSRTGMASIPSGSRWGDNVRVMSDH